MSVIDELKRRADDCEPNKAAAEAYRDAARVIERYGDGLQVFFYLLLRDKLSAGEVEQLVQSAESSKQKNQVYSNPFIADYAAELRLRLLR